MYMFLCFTKETKESPYKILNNRDSKLKKFYVQFL